MRSIRFRILELGVTLPIAMTGPTFAGNCMGDLNDDGITEGQDIVAVLARWGSCEKCPEDLDSDGTVAAEDLALVLFHWGPCPLYWAEVLEHDPDPAVIVEASLRSDIAATGLPWRVRDRKTQMELLLIPPGTFDMGCSASSGGGCAGDEHPVHSVTLTGAVYLGRYEVTQAQWMSVMGSNPSTFQLPNDDVPAEQVAMRPVESVTHPMIDAFNALAGLRLPTEAEWEFAYRAGTNTAFHASAEHPHGTSDGAHLGLIAWFGNESWTHPVGQKIANGFGLHDMSGNVFEFVFDWYSESYYRSSPGTDPVGPPAGECWSLRGGSYNAGEHSCRASARACNDALSDPLEYVGFRAARNP